MTDTVRNEEIIQLGATELSAAIHSRAVSCREVMEAYLERIHRINPCYKAIVSIRPDDELLGDADVCDAELARGASRGWMHGMPQAIKDLAPVDGLPFTRGSLLLRDNVAYEDDLMVARMKAAGCIVIGKTNTPEFGLGSHTFNEVFGTTVNAYDPRLSAGGSSGGAAVALALHLLPVADGSDFMGSLRNPAAWNNIFGFRPSEGRVPRWPAHEVWVNQLSTEGPMGRTVRDIARLLQTQAGESMHAPLCLPGSFVPLEELRDQPLRIGWLADLDGHLPMEDGILDACRCGLRRLERIGCTVSSASFDMDPERIWNAWLAWRHVLTASQLAPLLEQPGARSRVKPEVLWEYDGAKDYSATQFLQASTARSAFYEAILRLFKHHDVLALPTAQVWAFDAREWWPKTVAGCAMDTYHRWMEVVIYATFAGLPALDVPVGFNANGVPMGMQLIGAPRRDAELLQLGAAYEAVIADWLAIRPQIR